ncbi:MAG: PAS domain S-box protein [Calditrichaceae bacterium]
MADGKMDFTPKTLSEATAEINRLRKEKNSMGRIINRAETGLKALYEKLEKSGSDCDISQELSDLSRIYRSVKKSKENHDSETARGGADFELLFNRITDSAAFYELIIDESGKAIDYTIIDVNPAYESVFGQRKEEVTGIPASNLFKLGHAPYVEKFAEVTETGTPAYFETYFFTLRKHFSITVLPQGASTFAAVFHDITMIKEMDSELKNTRQMLDAIIKNTPDIIYRLDHEGNITFINDAVRYCGYDSNELIGKSILELVHPDDREKAFYHVKERRTGERSTKDFEVRLFSRCGDQERMLPRPDPVFLLNAEGLYTTRNPEKRGFKGTQGIARNITFKKITELKLKETNQTLNALFDASPLAIISIDSAGYVKRWNPAAERIFGWTESEVIGKKNPLGQNPDDPKFVALHQRVMSGESISGLEVKRRKKDGTMLDIRVSTAPLRDNNGEISGIMTILSDITQDRHVDEQLSRLASVVEQASESIIITDINGKIEYVNPTFEKVTGYSFMEVLDKNPRILKSGEHAGEFYKNLWNTLIANKTWTGTFANKRKDGSSFYETAVIFPIKNAAGKTINYAAVKRDITNERKLEQQLFQSQKMESIGLLTGSIAHDFNNIMTAILGYAELMITQMESDNPFYGKVIGIMKAGKKSSSLTRQLLAFSRKQIIEPRIININHVILELEKMLHRLIGEDIKMESILAGRIQPIKADPAQIEQILINLVINARDAINQKAKNASLRKFIIETEAVYLDEEFVSAHIGSNVGPYVRMGVKDNGTGMDKVTESKIFEPFFTTKEKERGTGLGLATVYGIVKQNNGCIFVETELGIGTLFNIYWPQSDEKDIQLYEQEEEREMGSGNETVLVVEDDLDVRKIACFALESFGYKILEASNGMEALKLVKSKKVKIDLIMTDVIMPEMGGKDLVDALKKIIPDIKVIFTSGYTDDRIVSSGVLQKGINFINKPYSFNALGKKVRDVLDH